MANILDVTASHPYYAAIHMLQLEGIISSPSGQFYPTAPVTRGQFACMLAKTVHYLEQKSVLQGVF